MSETVLITGGAGELGANYAKICLEKGLNVKIMDIIRENEAWRLKWLKIKHKVDYIWKSTFDIKSEDVEDAWLIMDCSCQPDRPMGTSSPVYTMIDNLLGPTRLLEAVIESGNRPIMMYPSSCNVFLGVPPKEQPLTESTYPMPTNYYGWSKLAAEELYLTYSRSHDMPVLIIRTGSCFGPGMRTDQMIAKCILHLINDCDFRVRSPNASRTFTYSADVMKFHELLLDKLLKNEITFGQIIHNGGNKEKLPFKTIEIAEKIKQLTDSKGKLIKTEYEFGEIIDNNPVVQWESYDYAEEILGWKPEHTIEQGLIKTIKWFDEHEGDYVI